jgi:hypothetical protein
MMDLKELARMFVEIEQDIEAIEEELNEPLSEELESLRKEILGE